MLEPKDIQLVPPTEPQPTASIQIVFTAPDVVKLFMTSEDREINLLLLHSALGMALNPPAEKKSRLLLPTTVTRRNGR